MMNNFMNNPAMDMFKKSMENHTNVWSQASETFKSHTNNLHKGFDFNSPNNQWMEAYTKMTENMPWMKFFSPSNETNQENPLNFMKNIKGAEVFADLSHLSLENSQAMMRRQAEITQKHTEELYKLMQNFNHSGDHKANMESQEEFIRSSFESMVADFKELAEMYTKANLETFEAASKKMAEQLGCKSHNKKHHSSEEKPNSSKTNHSKK